MSKRTAIVPTREQDYPEWYQQVVKAAELAETSDVRGCMVIKPWGYGIWENMQRILDGHIKETGHENAYFPLFIPLSYLQKEADHVEGFAKECAVVTHHKLEQDKEGKLVPAGELEEPLIVRPTSEMIIGETFSRWVESYRDLPLLINQWANVVRWEMRTRLFLRTAEFLWQEGHTVHSSEEEARAETDKMLGVYEMFCKKYLAIPVYTGRKSDLERFPGAEETYCIEAMMQDGKALQCGTSHYFGQRFAKASGIKFRSKEGSEEFGWTTSWGVTTRLIGALIMTHSDDDGLVLPPRISPKQIVIIPVIHKEETREKVMSYCKELQNALSQVEYEGRKLAVHLDARDMRGGEKVWAWVKKGVPMRIEVGPREVDEGRVSVTKRTKGHREFFAQTKEELLATVATQLEEIQSEIYEKALAFRDSHTVKIDTKEEFYAFFEKGNTGFVSAHYCGDPEMEKKLGADLSVSVRCIPDGPKEAGKCPFTGKPSAQRVLYAKSY